MLYVLMPTQYRLPMYFLAQANVSADNLAPGDTTDGNLSSRSVVIPATGPGVYVRHQKQFTRSRSKQALSDVVSDDAAASLSSMHCPRKFNAIILL